MRRRLLSLSLLATCQWFLTGWAEELPTIVSADYCADQYALALADRDQILALSPDAKQAFSYYRDEVGDLPLTTLEAEDVLGYAPDILLYTYGPTERALALYRRFGITPVKIDFNADGDWLTGFEDIRQAILTTGEALGHIERAQELAASLSLETTSTGQTATYITPGGAVAGEGTMVGEIMERAGLSNGAGHTGWRILSLEDVYLSPPNFALTAFFDFQAERTTHWSAGGHPLMARILSSADTLAMREDRISCSSWLASEEAAALAAELEERK